MSDEMEVQSTNLKRLRSDESETDLILHKMSKESKTKKNDDKISAIIIGGKELFKNSGKLSNKGLIKTAKM
jgi:hypothetical protein